MTKSRAIFFAFGMFLALGALPSALFADNGAYPLGFGAKSKAMGGAAVAFPQDSLAGLANPAGIVDVCNSIDGTIEYIYHTQKCTVKNSPFGGYLDGTYPFNGSKNLVLGELGYKSDLNDCTAFAITITPQSGGFIKQGNNKYTFSPPSIQQDKVNLKIAYIAITPCLAWRINPCHSVGFALDATFAAANVKGVHGLANELLGPGITINNATAYPNHVTNRGWNFAQGIAFRVGWLGHFHRCVSVGLSYRSKTHMSRFNEYMGLITPKGRADLPAVWAAGLAFKGIPQTVIAFDYNRIEWGKVPTFGNRAAQVIATSINPLQLALSNPHGSDGGAAFQWHSTNVFKFGIIYDLCDCIILRAGYNYGKSPIPKVGTFESRFLPSTVEHHLTLGFSWMFACCSELSFAYIHGFRNSISGTFDPVTPPAAEEIVQLSRTRIKVTSQVDHAILQWTCYF